MEAEAIILILALIFAIIALIVGIIGLVLIETKYANNTPWWVHLMIWGGFIVFIIALIIVAFMGVSLSNKKKKRKMAEKMRIEQNEMQEELLQEEQYTTKPTKTMYRRSVKPANVKSEEFYY